MENFQVNIFGVISIFGTLQGLILTFIFMFNKNYSRKSNRYLSILLLICSVINFMGMLEEANMFQEYPILHFLPVRFYSLIAPIVYFFVQYLINPKYQFKRQEYLLFIPFVIDFSYQFSELVAFLNGSLELNQDMERHYFITNTFETIAAIFNLIISIIAIKRLWAYEKSLYNQYAEINDKSLKWLFNTLVGGCMLTFFWLITALIDFFPFPFMDSLGRVIWLGVSVLIYWIGYAMLMRPELFIEEKELVEEVVLNEETKLSDKTDEHYQKLLNLLQEEELFRNPNLNMDILSKSIGLSKGYLSQIINAKEGKNFFDFINTYRVEDVKLKLTDSSFDHFNILGIALDAGFKSKSTFNSVFKKMTGKTPSQFKNHRT